MGATKKAQHTRTKVCLVCGTPFTLVGTQQHDRITCSLPCSYKLRGDAKKDRVGKICKTCGIDFDVPKHQAKTAHYCSKRCMYRRNDPQTTRSCAVCGTEFRSPPSHMHVLTCSPDCGYEIRDTGDRRIAFHCGSCGKPVLESPSRHGARVYCSRLCMFTSERHQQGMRERVSKEKNPSWKGGVTRTVVSAAGLTYSRMAPERENEKNSRRTRVRKGATPAWANLDQILAIYRMAQQLASQTGAKYHVDHIVPLQSDIVCGLHCEANLQVLPALANLQKHNRAWPDMP